MSDGALAESVAPNRKAPLGDAFADEDAPVGEAFENTARREHLFVNISREGVGAARFTDEGRTLLFSTWGERRGNVWALSLEDGEEYPITDLVGRPGNMGRWGLATDGEYVYFLWTQAVGDIWVMDVVQE